MPRRTGRRPTASPKTTPTSEPFASVTWRPSVPAAENSIELAYRRAIGQAEKFIYLENQYLIGSGLHWQDKGSDHLNDIPERIVAKILERAAAGKPFHVYIVKPMFPEGNPVGSTTLEIRKNEWLTAQYMVKTLAGTLGDNWSDYIAFYFLANWQPQAPVNQGDRKERVRGNDRYMVYVHSKLMIVDDRYFILGSANLNERSLNGGRDSEIACGVWPGFGHEDDAMAAIRKLRLDLWHAHFGPAAVAAEAPESPACVTSATSIGAQNYAALRTLAAPPNGLACRWPYGLDQQGLLMVDAGRLHIFDHDKFLPDSPNTEKVWQWASPGSWWIKISGFGE